jgi:3-hydroxyacyl-CoA dehydrogenase
MHAISPEVMEGLNLKPWSWPRRNTDGMVIWSGDAPFSVGADLEATMPAFAVGGPDAVESIEQELQNLMLRMRYAQVPVVAAIHGMALGGGCELAVYSAKPRGAHGKLHRPGRSGRGPGARRRRPDLHRAPCGREHAERPQAKT